MDLEDSLIKCNGCPKRFAINGIRTHIRQTSCKNQYTSAEFDHLVKLCESHARKKRAENYKQKRDQKNVKVKKEFCKSILDSIIQFL